MGNCPIVCFQPEKAFRSELELGIAHGARDRLASRILNLICNERPEMLDVKCQEQYQLPIETI